MKKEAIWTIGLVISLSVLLICPGMVCAGPNASAGCALDLDYTTRDYDPGITSKDIESEVDAAANEEIWVAVVAQNVTNLDTYQVEVNFDPLRMSFLEGYEDNAFAGVENLLKMNGGTTIGFQAVETTAGTGNVSNALTGMSTDEAPEGSGIIALLKFRVLDEDLDNGLTLSGAINFIV